MTQEQCDIFISGGGLAGMAAAAVFGSAGFSVICADPTPPVTTAAEAGSDLRTTAILQPGQALLAEAGVWEHLAPFATPLKVMRIVDISGTTRVARDFDSADLGEAPFGWNLPNWLLRREMLKRLQELDTVDLRFGIGASTLRTRSSAALIGLSDGTRVTARLAVAADGRQSHLRQQAGIGVRKTTFGQHALAFAVTHELPHENVSTELHLKGGPFTLVPLPDHEGKPCSAIVWMDDTQETERRLALEPAAFETEMTARSGGVLGPLTLASRLTSWPIISQLAERFTAERLALVAEAAHVVPPIGAQGLNMSLKDIQTLYDLALSNRDMLGAAPMLTAYQKARFADVAARVAGVTALNKTSQLEIEVLQKLRRTGIGMIHDLSPVRRVLMRTGLGAAFSR